MKKGEREWMPPYSSRGSVQVVIRISTDAVGRSVESEVVRREGRIRSAVSGTVAYCVQGERFSNWRYERESAEPTDSGECSIGDSVRWKAAGCVDGGDQPEWGANFVTHKFAGGIGHQHQE